MKPPPKVGKGREKSKEEGSSGERLQKVLAHRGLGSRREIESWIAAGRVTVNTKAAPLGTRVGRTDVLRVDGHRVDLDEHTRVRVLVYNKPEGEICTRHDPEGRATVYDRLPRLRTGRWISVGRLDINTQGLLLFTNDGELAHRLTHPSFTLEREYAVRVLGAVGPQVLATLSSGVELDDGPARFTSIRDAGGEGANHWYHVTLVEGRNREVHRLWASQLVRISRLVRVRYGPVSLPRWLRSGRFSQLAADELVPLLQAVNLHRRLKREAPKPHDRERRRLAKMPARSPKQTPRRRT